MSLLAILLRFSHAAVWQQKYVPVTALIFDRRSHVMLPVVILCHEMFADQFKEMTSQVNFVRKNWSKEAIFSSFFLWGDHFAWTLSWFKIWFISFDCQLIILSQSTTFCTSYAGAKFPENWRNFQQNHEKIPRFSLFKFLGGLLFTGISLSARSLGRVAFRWRH